MEERKTPEFFKRVYPVDLPSTFDLYQRICTLLKHRELLVCQFFTQLKHLASDSLNIRHLVLKMAMHTQTFEHCVNIYHLS